MKKSLMIWRLKNSAPHDPGSKSTPVKDQTGSTFNRGDFTATGAFIWSSLNLSVYAGSDLGHTPYFVELIDGAGKKASGYLGAVGAGETLGSELITGWNNFTWDTFLYTGKEINSAIRITGGIAVSNLLGTVNGQLFKNSGTPTIISGGDVGNPFSYLFCLVGGTGGLLNLPAYSAFSAYFGQTDAANKDYLAFRSSVPVSCSVANYSLKRVTDPPSTAVHIVSSLNGTIRNWKSIDSGFDPNSIASWIIYG